MPSNILLKVGDANGSVTQKEYDKYIECQTWKLGMTTSKNPQEIEPTGRPALQELVVTKGVDQASIDLMKFLVGGTILENTVQLVMLTNENATSPPVVTINLSRCVVSSVEHSGGDAATAHKVVETVKLRFGAIEFVHHGKEDHEMRYNIVTNVVG